MEENKPKLTGGKLALEMMSILLTAFGIGCISLLRRMNSEVMLSTMVLGVAGVMILGFYMRQAYLNRELDYDNNEHYTRFWCCFLLGLAGAFLCAVLPVAGWPYVTVFVLLSLFGNMSGGILGASVLLALSVTLNGGDTVIFVLYFLTGVFSVTLFRNMDDRFHIGSRMFLTLLCQLLCETAGVVLLANERLSLELLLIPTANLIISGILLLGILKLFFSMVIYKNQEQYLDLSDKENAILTEYRKRSKADYMHGVHTAHFCELIAGKLALNVEDMKCACYYHKLAKERPALLEEYQFPPGAKGILAEYISGKPLRRKETAVLLCADTVVTSIQYLLAQSKEQGLDYDYIIDNLFKRFGDADTFVQCDITMKELRIIQNIFKEEKLYYDFLR